MDVIERLRIKNEDLLRQLIQTHLSFIIDIDSHHSFANKQNIKKKFTNNCESYLQ